MVSRFIVALWGTPVSDTTRDAPLFHGKMRGLSRVIGITEDFWIMASPGSTDRMVFCAKLQRELPALTEPTWPGPLGQRIFEQVSQEAWEMWEERMKMILNEYKLLPFQKEAQALIAKQMEEFLFGGDSAVPPGYVKP